MIFISIFTVLFFIYWIWVDLYHNCKDQKEEIDIFGFFFHAYYRVFKEYKEKRKKKI